jgi:hypothetical protein
MKTTCLKIIPLISLLICVERAYCDNVNKTNPDNFITASSTATNGLMLGVYFWHPFLSTNTTEQIITLSFSLSNEVGTVYVPANEYFVRFALYDAKNRPVSKTALGSSYDIKTNQLVWWDDKYMGSKKHGEHTPFNVLPGKWSRGVDLPMVSQLFQLKKAGDYRLVIETQVFFRHNSKGNAEKEIICFPPLEIPVIEPAK